MGFLIELGVYFVIFLLNVGLGIAAANWAGRKGYPEQWGNILLLSILVGCVLSILIVSFLPQRAVPLAGPRRRAPLPRFAPKINASSAPQFPQRAP